MSTVESIKQIIETTQEVCEELPLRSCHVLACKPALKQVSRSPPQRILGRCLNRDPRRVSQVKKKIANEESKKIKLLDQIER
jgi:hypothetical protein